MNQNHDWTALGRETIDIEIEGLHAVRSRLGESFNLAVELLSACKGRVVITGLGKSGLVGRKIAATLSSTGTPSFFMHPVEGQHGDLGSIRADDTVIAISNSGRTDELNSILPALRSLGVKIVALTGGVDSPLARYADACVDTGVPREACPLNLAPTSSTTAALAVGDALAVCLIKAKAFTEKDFKRIHPGGALGQRLSEPVAAIMRKLVPTTPLDAVFSRAVADVHKGGLGASIIVDAEGKAAGILTDGDIRRAFLAGGFNPDRRASEFMTKSFRHATSKMRAADALNLMEDAAITVLPVLDDYGGILGVIHLHDLLGKGDIKFD